MGRPARILNQHEVVRRHLDGEPITRIARDIGVHAERVRDVLQRSGVEVVLGAWGKYHPRWTGGRSVCKTHGYVHVTLARDDQLREMCDKNGTTTEHRYVMARHLGRPLRSDETVHHIDGDKEHNDLSNLQLRVGAHGEGILLRCHDCGSRNIHAEGL